MWGETMSQWLRRWRSIVSENRRYLYASVLLFAGGIALGWAVMQAAPDAASQALKQLIAPVSRIAERLAGMSPLSQAVYIFGNNLRVAVVMLIGAFFLGALPPIVLISNGLLIGLFAANLPAAGALSASRFLLGLIPHGVFEIPAVLLNAMMGLRIAREIWRSILGRGSQGLREAVRQAVTLLPAVVVLLIIAAGMETYVSPVIIGTPSLP